MTSGFAFEIKGIFVALYFAVWIAAVVFVLMTYIIPYFQDWNKRAKKKASAKAASPITPPPFRSPRSGLPLRDRIAVYVAERRKEDGLAVPEPLRPSRTVSAGPVASSSAGSVIPKSSVSPAISATQSVKKEDIERTPSAMGSGGDALGDLPLPDDFGSVDDSDGDMGSLPGLDGDIDDFGELGGSDYLSSDIEDEGGLVDDSGEMDGMAAFVESTQPGFSPASTSSASASSGELPGFDGDLEVGLDDSDLMPDSMSMDLSDDDLLVMDDDASMDSSSSMSHSAPSDGLSEAGLPDLGESLEPDIMDSDLSVDEDFGDIEFMDLEPEEPPKPKK
jgi:hypothetical protein